MADKICVKGGFIGGTQYPIPAYPRIHQTSLDGNVLCNRLRCLACHSPVKHRDGEKTRVRWPGHLAARYDQPDHLPWREIVEAITPFRLYFCRCSWVSTCAWTPVGHLDTHDIDDWTCAGHPGA